MAARSTPLFGTLLGIGKSDSMFHRMISNDTNERWLDPTLWEKISVENLTRHLAEGADIDARDESGNTPLHFAA